MISMVAGPSERSRFSFRFEGELTRAFSPSLNRPASLSENCRLPPPATRPPPLHGPPVALEIAHTTRTRAQSCPSHRIKPNQNSQLLDNAHLVWTALNTTGIMALRSEMIGFLRKKEAEGKMGPDAWGQGKVSELCKGGPDERGPRDMADYSSRNFFLFFSQGLVFTAGNAVSTARASDLAHAASHRPLCPSPSAQLSHR